jgi:hypothetical protein
VGTKVNDGFILFDTETGQPESLRVYKRKCDVGNSYGQWNRPSWTDQTRFIAKPIRIIDAETGDYFT